MVWCSAGYRYQRLRLRESTRELKRHALPVDESRPSRTACPVPRRRRGMALRVIGWLRVASLAVLCAFLGASSATADAGDVLRWQQLGHVGDLPVQWLAVPPDGLASGLLFAGLTDPKHTEIRRSRDGGRDWETVADAPGRIVLPQGGAAAFSLGTNAVYRSTDAGETWTAVLPLAGAELVLSPAFAQDGIAFARGGGKLWRSMDGGATWANLDPGQGQVIEVVRLSPAFATDRTVFVGADSTSPPTASGTHPGSPTDPADSLGVLLSQDAGESWTSVSDGLQIDDAPFRQVMDIAISPSYAQDRTIFTAALGPWQSTPQNPGTIYTAAVFRSRDAGASWDAVRQERSGGTYISQETLALSSGFASDQTLLWSDAYGSDSMPVRSGCSLAVSSDAGDSWHNREAPQGADSSSWTGLCGLGTGSLNGSSALLAYPSVYYLAAPALIPALHSVDGGATWITLGPPGDWVFESPDVPGIVARQSVVPGALLRGTQQGDLWAYASFPPCSIQPALGFGRLWTQHPELRQPAGCPVAPEQPLTLQVRHVEQPGQAYDLYWTATTPSLCVQVFYDVGGPSAGWPAHTPEAQGCTGLGDQTRPGSILSFANGHYWLYIEDPGGSGFVVTSAARVWTQPLLRP